MKKGPSRNRTYRTESVPQWDFEADVIVVGMGGAGTCAAIEAVSAGCSVIAFEVSSAPGGTSTMSGGEMYLGGGTEIQKACGIEDSTEDMYQYLMMTGGPNADEAKTCLYVDSAADHLQWMKGQGIEYKNSFVKERIVEPQTDDCLLLSGSEESWPFSEKAKVSFRGHTPKREGLGGGSYLMETLINNAKNLGVIIECNARAIALIASAEGEIDGLVVRIEGEDKFARARKGVILTAGGFIMNRDMVKKHAPMLLRAQEPIGSVDDGSGILLGQSAGGAAINMAEGLTTITWFPPESLIFGIFINENGARFINEDCYHGRTAQFMMEQPTDRIFLLVDGDCYAEPYFSDYSRVSIVATGETWEEVEEELGLVKNTLVNTVDLYNHHAELGEDPLYHKNRRWIKPLTTPPFVALDFRIDYCTFFAFTLGGLDTLPSGEVLSADREIIPGLYAAGRNACGVVRWGKGYSSGMSLGDATFFGRQAGISAAKRSTSR